MNLIPAYYGQKAPAQIRGKRLWLNLNSIILIHEPNEEGRIEVLFDSASDTGTRQGVCEISQAVYVRCIAHFGRFFPGKDSE